MLQNPSNFPPFPDFLLTPATCASPQGEKVGNLCCGKYGGVLSFSGSADSASVAVMSNDVNTEASPSTPLFPVPSFKAAQPNLYPIPDSPSPNATPNSEVSSAPCEGPPTLSVDFGCPREVRTVGCLVTHLAGADVLEEEVRKREEGLKGVQRWGAMGRRGR